jgi:hypothetical protein
MDAALKHYVDRVGFHEVSREADGRVYLRAWDEFDRHSVVLRPADVPGMDCGVLLGPPGLNRPDFHQLHKRPGHYEGQHAANYCFQD